MSTPAPTSPTGHGGPAGASRLPTATRRVILANSLSALGNGFTLPFLVIYLHEVRGLSLVLVGVVVATTAVVGLFAGPVAGALIDSLGARRMLLAALAAATVGSLVLADVHSAWQAFVAAGLMGLAGSTLWSGISALVAFTTPPELRQRAFGVEFQLLNAGIGIGGICGGLLADTGRPSTFVLLYVVDAASYVVCGLVLLSLRGLGRPSAPEPADAEASGPGGYREVLGDRTFVRLCGLTFLAAACGYVQLEAGFPAFARGYAEVSTFVIGVAFAVNTLVIVLAQMLVLRYLHGRRRNHVLALVGVIWSAAWLITGAAGLLPGTVTASVLVGFSLGVFALGETLWQPTSSTLLNELAPPHLRGRYNALGGLMWQSAGVVGPPVAGALLGAGLAVWWVALVVLGMLAYAAGALRIGRILTPAQNGVGALAAGAGPHEPIVPGRGETTASPGLDADPAPVGHER